MVMASTGQLPWPSPGSSHGHQRAAFRTASGQVLLAVDILPSQCAACVSAMSRTSATIDLAGDSVRLMSAICDGSPTAAPATGPDDPDGRRGRLRGPLGNVADLSKEGLVRLLRVAHAVPQTRPRGRKSPSGWVRGATRRDAARPVRSRPVVVRVVDAGFSRRGEGMPGDQLAGHRCDHTNHTVAGRRPRPAGR
jgi:hypothetical protein